MLCTFLILIDMNLDPKGPFGQIFYNEINQNKENEITRLLKTRKIPRFRNNCTHNLTSPPISEQRRNDCPMLYTFGNFCTVHSPVTSFPAVVFHFLIPDSRFYLPPRILPRSDVLFPRAMTRYREPPIFLF